MASVCVLTPYGRRQTVKCTPNTTILQILEDACKKQGLKPEEYDLKHHNKILDTTATFRFSGLPNNAQLELVNAVKTRSDSEVILALCLESGSRFTGNFLPSDTLMDVLQRLCPENAQEDRNPVIIYTRREIYGEELKQTTLKSLGLTGGRAMLRLMNRNPEELKTQANISAPIPAKPVEEKPYHRTFQKLEEPSQTASNLSESLKSPEIKPDEATETDCQPLTKEKKQVKPVTQQKTADLVKLAKEKCKEESKTPNVPKDRALQKNNKQQSIEDSQAEAMDVDVQETHFHNLETNNALTSQHQVNVEEEFVFVGDRNAMIFSLESAQSVPSEELPDDFFELTVNDAQNILRDIKKRRLELEQGGPLITSALRNLEDSKKQLRQLSKYKKAIIRILFPNRTILQGVFKPTDRVADVMKFVQEYLEDPKMAFYLYTTPPKSILEQTCRLIEVDCVPGALVYFGATSIDTNIQYLRKDLQDKFTSSSVASLAASMVRQQSRRPDSGNSDNSTCVDDTVDADVAVPSTSSSVPRASTTVSSGANNPVTSTSENVPKWFKTSK